MIEYENAEIKKLQILVEASQKPYLSLNEAQALYCLGRNKIIDLAKEAGAIRKIGTRTLVNAKVLNEYIESLS